MHYLVKGEFVEGMLTGRTPEDNAAYFEYVVKPSLEALWKLGEEKKLVGGGVAGVGEIAFIIDVDSDYEVGRLLRTLPYRGADRWSVSPLQPFQSVLRPGPRGRPGHARHGRRKLGPVEPSSSKRPGRSRNIRPGPSSDRFFC